MLSPLNLKRVTLESIDLQADADVRLDPGTPQEYKITVKTEVDELSGREYRVMLELKFRPQPDAVCQFRKVSARLAGIFAVASDAPDKLVDQIVPSNCFAMLYGMARGILGQATGLAPGGPFILPPFNFVAYTEQHKRREARKSKSELVAGAIDP